MPYIHLFEQNAAEGTAEVLVENGIDDGVQGRIHVPQPEGNCERLVGNMVPADVANRC